MKPGPSPPATYARPPISATVVLVVGVYLSAFAGLVALAGGAVIRWTEVPAPGPGDQDELHLLLGLLVAAAGCTLLSGLWLGLQWPKWTAFTSTLFAMVTVATLVTAEIVERRFTPPWPAAALHGVTPDANHQPWGLLGRRPDQVGFNTWGQRDRERTLQPAESVYRIAFIGDSFLDETVSEPISLITERLMNSPKIEIINLGVSATSPDEYYFRLANVALPLGVDACVMFLYLGNDLAAGPRTLHGSLGITAVSPRGSLLDALQLRSLNHLATNRQRPVLQAWGVAGELADRERRLHQRFQNATDEGAIEILLSLEPFPPPVAAALVQRLRRPEASAFLEMLRHPDAGLFRSYFLVDSLWLAGLGQAPLTIDDINSARHWVKLSHEHCQQRGLPFLLVVIPQGFAVDQRLQEMWSPLADVAGLTDKTEVAAMQLLQQLTIDGVELLDLHTTLRSAPGSYLNLDGHWSESGIHCVAAEVEKRIRGWTDPRLVSGKALAAGSSRTDAHSPVTKQHCLKQ
ncbi:MAG: hypothetical protein JSS49_18020 [Planctomycetes bacterium]|nr:hypothetical protein [Planctomycetota bacterium]